MWIPFSVLLTAALVAPSGNALKILVVPHAVHANSRVRNFLRMSDMLTLHGGHEVHVLVGEHIVESLEPGNGTKVIAHPKPSK